MRTRVYACYNTDESIREISSSGGIYYLLANEIIQKRGVVYAAVYEGIKVKHIRIADRIDLGASCGSKYIPSELGDTFTNIENEIIAGTHVLFVGLPCQCEGLLTYIQNDTNKSWPNLYLVDLICHGIPSKKAWNNYCDSLRSNGFDIASVNMRNKATGWKNHSWLMSDKNGQERMESHNINVYMKGFVSDIYNRPCCSECMFKGIERNTDVTLGDYWGVQNIQSKMDDDKGTSLIMIHSEKGQKLFESISDYIIYDEAPIEQAVKYNPSIITSAKSSVKRGEFFSRSFEGEDFRNIVDHLLKKPIGTRIRSKIKKVKSIFKNITNYKFTF